MTEQTVAENNPEQSASGAEEGAQDLDALLNEFDDAPKPPKEEKPVEQQDDSAELKEFVREYKQREIQQKTETDLKDTVNVIKEQIGELPFDEPDGLIEALLIREAEKDRRVASAWMNRADSPAAWDKIRRGLANKFAKQLSIPDTKATRDWKAINSAVRSSTTTTPVEEKVDVAGMSDSEFMKYKQSLRK